MGQLLQVTKAVVTGTVTTWSLTVPGNHIWYPRSFIAVAATQAGGAPNRAYTLSITDGTSLVGKFGAVDAGTEPATVTITWTNSAQGDVTAGAIGVVVAPMASPILKPGYVITGTIVNPAAGDTWVSALAWYDYTLSNN